MSDKTIYETAQVFGTVAYRGQNYGDKPYSVHLESVEFVLKQFGWFDYTLGSAAWLHDVVEDTMVSSDFLRQYFPSSIVDLVDAVTNEPGVNRSERHAATYPKIRRAGEKATILKLADRISNVTECVVNQDSKLKMYRKEHPAFRDALYVQGVTQRMWDHLDIMLS